MRKRSLAAAIVVALALAPGTVVRTAIPRGDEIDFSIGVFDQLPEATSRNGLTREGVWELSSERLDFGGYSALLVLDGNILRAFSDRGTTLTFAAPGGSAAGETRFSSLQNRGELAGTVPDIEAAVRDPATGTYWVAFENTHSLIRYSRANDFEAARVPPEWQGWYENAGVEAMARLPDGRFLVLPERADTGFLYASDPAQEVESLAFRFAVPDDYNPTDMASLPDGRVLVLLRKLDKSFPPFAVALAVADPRTLEEGGELQFVLLADLTTILPRENYEALELAGIEEDGSIGLWLMSDDNLSAFQRTLLARISWAGDAQLRKHNEKAREG